MREVKGKFVGADKALKCIRNGHHIFIGSGSAEPDYLVKALEKRASSLVDIEVVHILTLGEAFYSKSRYRERFRHNAFFIGPNVRDSISSGNADYTPCFLSEVPGFFKTGRLPIDVALVQVSPPDRHGFCSLGISVDVVKSAVESARVVVAQVNPRMPRTHGNSFIPLERIDFPVKHKAPIRELKMNPPKDVARQIGRHVSRLVDSGSTMQMGIGEIPDAVLLYLKDKKDLGVHTEMLSDGVMELVKAGVINNRRKTLHPGKLVCSFCMGSRRLYDFVDDNPILEFHPSNYVNDPVVIALNDKMISINSAIQVDLTGQVCADSIGPHFYSGFGGQVDFIRGAARSKGGKSIIALPSTAKGGSVSRIVPFLNQGAGVVTTRADVDYVVTEYGIAHLKGKTVRERALALIHVAHPGFRDRIMQSAKDLHYVYRDQIQFPKTGRPYPSELESQKKLKGDLTIKVRPLKPTDERFLRDLFYSHTKETIYFRYGVQIKSLSRKQIQEFVTLDYDERMAVGAFMEKGAEKLISVARYHLDRSTDMVDLLLTVHDSYQNRGLGTFMLQYILRIAKSRGAKGFSARITRENTRMVHILHNLFGSAVSRVEGNTYVFTVKFDELDLFP